MKPRKLRHGIKTFLIPATMFCLVLTLLIPGCSLVTGQSMEPTQTVPETSPPQIPESSTPGLSNEPEELFQELILKEILDLVNNYGNNATCARGSAPFGLYSKIVLSKAPLTNHPVELNWCIRAAETWEELHVWVQFEYDSGKPGDSRGIPPDEAERTILRDGQLRWDGSIKEGEEKQFNAVIAFPASGDWLMSIKFLGKTVYRDFSNGVEGRFAAYGDSQNLFVDEEYSQLGYRKNHYGDGNIVVPNNQSPASGYVDMAKPPALNEPVEIKWGAGSIKDIKGVKLHMDFLYLEPGNKKWTSVPPEEIVISGDSSQSIKVLSKNEQFISAFHDPVDRLTQAKEKTSLEMIIEHCDVHYTTLARFSEEGDWSIHLWIDWIDDTGLWRSSGIFATSFSISTDGSIWGWPKRHR